MAVFVYLIAVIWIGLGAYGMVTSCTRSDSLFSALAITNGCIFAYIAMLFARTRERPE